jgi:hypothetical protein
MSAGRLAAALAGGLLLAALPFLRYAHLGGPVAAHADHAPRHGGRLVMTGEHHLELVRRGARVEVFASDAWRSPLRPRDGFVVLDRGARAPLLWRDHRLVADGVPPARELEAVVVLDDGTRLAARFDLP